MNSPTDHNKIGSSVGHVGPYRTVRLSRVIDPETESRRCNLKRHMTNVQGVQGYHTDVDIVTHLGTHVEAPYHHIGLSKDVIALAADHYIGRGVLLRLNSCRPGALIERSDLDLADNKRVKVGDIVVLDSPYHAEPFAQEPDDQRPHLSEESARWFVEKQVKAVGFGDGIAIENNAQHCIACHDIMLGNDVLFIEVMENINLLEQEIFLIIFTPLPIRGLDSSPVNVMAIEGIPGFTV